MPRIRWRRAELADGHNDAQPSVRASVVALATHRIDYLARLGRRVVVPLGADAALGHAQASVRFVAERVPDNQPDPAAIAAAPTAHRIGYALCVIGQTDEG